MQVTLITCTWNSKKTIKNCCISISNQTYNDIEYIIIDKISEDYKIMKKINLNSKDTFIKNFTKISQFY